MNPVSRWLRRRRLDRELAEEMSEHLAEKIEQLREDGHSEAEARALARRQFGNVSLLREDSRSAWGWNALEQLWQDVRFGRRLLAKAPGFTAVTIAVLALGIGMNTAMFSVVKTVLLSALPYPEPERLVELGQVAKNGHVMHVSALDFADWRGQNRSMEALTKFGRVNSTTLSGDFPARRVPAAAVGAGFFDVIATNAAFGRTFSDEEQKVGGPSTVVLGYELAVAEFGTAANAVQRVVHVNGLTFTVIGVMPPKFDFPDRSQLWLPNDLFPDDSSRSAHNYRVFGRLRSGVTVAQAQADMNVVASRLAQQYVDDRGEGIRVTPLLDSLVGAVRPALRILLAAVVLVLLIACVNVSNLQMARAAARRKELGMRWALGAARGRLIRQLLTESVLLSGTGGLLGLVLANAGVAMLRAAAPANIPRMENLGIDTGVLWFTAGVSLAVGLLFGVLPSLDASRSDVNDALKQDAARGITARHRRWEQMLVVGQISLAIVLMSGAAILLKSYWSMAHAETGMASGGVYAADLTWPIAPDGNSADGAFVRQAGGQILAQIGELPGVQAVALIHSPPFRGAPDGAFEIEGRPLPADPHLYPDADYRMVSSGYFRLFGIPILQGRDFSNEDERSGVLVAIVNQSFQRRFFPDGDPLGKRVKFLGFDLKPQFLTIVGIVPDVRESGLNQRVHPQVYSEYLQHADAGLDADLLVRGPAGLQPRIKSIVTSLNRTTAVTFENVDDLISGTIARERFQTALLALFAGCALLLALVGVYGLVAYTVSRRTNEMGLRIALGASRGSITRLVLGQGGVLIGAGVVLGSVGSLLTMRTIEGLMSGVTANPWMLSVVAAGFAVAALAGCWVPARRAARIDPSEALRAE